MTTDATGQPPATGDGDEPRGQTFWDARYGARGQIWSGQPNPQLVEHAAALTPGTALDVGCGEGADASWLAERGWQVVAADVSPVALSRGAQHAAELGPEVAQRIDWRHEDLLAAPGSPLGTFDLISAQFMHVPKAPREALFARLAAAVAPGGTLLIVGHHPSDLQTTIKRPPNPGQLFTAEELAATLDPAAWTIEVQAAVARTATDAQGQSVTIHDAVLRARRAGAPGNAGAQQ